MKGLFITGTDTGVGKTHAAALLLQFLRAKGLDVVPMKPVQTGYPASDDLTTLLAAGDIVTDAEERTWMNPYAFPLPASPHLAAAHAGRSISLRGIEAAFHKLADRHDGIVVEGAGGLRVPLTSASDMLDLIQRLRLPAVVAARTGLGTLNHTSLTCAALKSAGVPLAGILLSRREKGPPDLIERDNRATLKRLWKVPVEFLPYATVPKPGTSSLRNFQALEIIWRHARKLH